MFERYRSRFTTSPIGVLWVDPPPDPNAPPADPKAPPADPKAPPVDPNAPPPGEKTYSFKEDRSEWVDPARFKKAEAAVNRTASELDAARREIAARDKRVQLLVVILANLI